jgi:type II secretory ATPase GspE/PulE/Tfp pilus assembly ATPase PilB-like protein
MAGINALNSWSLRNRTMYQDGLLKALSGETTMEEVLRVTRDV